MAGVRPTSFCAGRSSAFISPRWGEIVVRSTAGEGDRISLSILKTPHPNPLPASGARGRIAFVARALAHWTAILFVAVTILLPPAAFAVQPDEVMRDPAKESRARALSRELRCMVCQNQSIDDSEAPLARDLRLLVRERIAAGDNDKQVLDYLVTRYGEFVLLKPPVEGQTLILWLLTPAVLIGGGVGLWLYNRRRWASRPEDVTALTPEETARLEKLMADIPDSQAKT